MNRDFELVRLLLINAEECDDMPFDALSMDGYSAKQIAYHAELLEQHGLVRCKVAYASGRVPVAVDIDSVTWDGHDYIDAIRDHKVWKRAVDIVSKTVGTVTLSTMKTVCEEVAMSMIMSAIKSMK